MSTDIELLPLPPLYIAPSVEPVDYPNVAHALMDYARANVAHATAAKDAEIERLRAEVRELRKRQAGWERHVAAAGCEYVRDGEHDALVNRRAERLAEALRELVALGHPRDPAIIAAKNALRDHDQEGGNP